MNNLVKFWSVLSLFIFICIAAPNAQAKAAEAEAALYASMSVVEKEGGVKLELPLKRTSIRTQITDTQAVTDISQIYKNDTGRKIEVSYKFPLPNEGAVTDMVIQINDRTVIGTIKEREQARKEFEKAKAAGKTAALTEQERPNMFTQSISNILPGDELKVTMRVSHPLRYSAGSFEYTFPITIGPRYMGGTPTGKKGEGWSPDTTKTPDASLVSPQYIPAGIDTSHLLDLELTISSKIKITDVASTSHAIKVGGRGANTRTVTLSPLDSIPNKDFILRYSTESKVPQFSLLTHRSGNEDGFFSITIIPPTERAAGKIIPKEMVFVLDRSGSMEGVTMEKAKEALKKSLMHLGEKDSFNIIIFDTDVERLWPAPKPSTAENVRSGVRYAETVMSRGGTEMEEPLVEALGYPVDPARQRIVLFITDGNVGYEERLLGRIKKSLGNSRIFTVGIGSSVNRYLVGEVAREGKGVAEYIRQDENVAERLSSIYAKISSPVLTGVDLDFGGAKVSELFPEKARDLFFEEPTVILGRYSKEHRGKLKIKADSADGKVALEFDLDLPKSNSMNPALRYAWAKKKIESLSLTALGKETEELKAQIIDVSTKYSVLSKYTAFIAVEHQVRDKSLAKAERWLIPSELPEGLRFEGFGPEVQMTMNRMRPGDPVILVDAPLDAKSVVVVMPFGETLKLEHDEVLDRYSVRFLIPFGMADGRYEFFVVVTAANGSVKTHDAFFVVDSLAPELTVAAVVEKGRLVIEAVPEANVFISGAVEVWPDVKEVIATLHDGREVTLKLNPSKKSRWIWRWEGELGPEDMDAGAISIKVRVVDYAGNWNVTSVVVKDVKIHAGR